MSYKTPTIRNLLNCMPSTGLSSIKDTLATYASLSFYFDGEDMKAAKINKIKAKMKLMDESVPKPKYTIEEVNDGDSFDLVVGSERYLFNVPTINTMPDIKSDDVPGSILESIEKLAGDPKSVLNLPYSYSEGVTEVLGKLMSL